MQLKGKTLFKAQVPTAPEHFQGYAHGQGRAGLQQVGGAQRPLMAVGDRYFTQLLHNTRHVG
ncbi:hypothetical protein D3C80_2159510 [compost metagenome]